MEPFYEQLDETTFASSELTAGPWGPDSQHAGPPSALLARAIERFEPREGHRLGRVSVDILGPVPIAPLQIEVERLRPGRRLELFEARAETNDRTVLVARAWRLACTPADFPSRPERVAGDVIPHDLPDPRPTGLHWVHEDGYMAAIEFRYQQGSFDETGPAVAWARQTVALVDDEEPTPWQRALVLADSGSGISLALDPTRYPAINCDLSVALHREPGNEWIGLDAVTTINAGSGALTTTTMLDHDGPIGIATQTLLAG
ncbi:thioesterase family protein [Aeromicrobium sp.]|uniref:thioesterase family protein n=1 Tax=Aeromicrobium sp. TaxID=1871063 RepID=UPI003D6B706A